jgi:hypothetical protein
MAGFVLDAVMTFATKIASTETLLNKAIGMFDVTPQTSHYISLGEMYATSLSSSYRGSGIFCLNFVSSCSLSIFDF